MDAALLADSLAALDEQLQEGLWPQEQYEDEEPIPPPCGASSILQDHYGRQWSVSQHFDSNIVRLAPLRPGQPALIPGLLPTSQTFESIEQQLEAGRGWYNAFPWPQSLAEAWFSIQGTPQAAQITLAVPRPVEAASEEATLFLVRRADDGPEVLGFRHREIRLQADRGGPTAHWRVFHEVEGFASVPAWHRWDLRAALLEIARLFPIERPSLLVPVDRVRAVGTPDPETYLSSLTELDLLGALWKAVR